MPSTTTIPNFQLLLWLLTATATATTNPQVCAFSPPGAACTTRNSIRGPLRSSSNFVVRLPVSAAPVPPAVDSPPNDDGDTDDSKKRTSHNKKQHKALPYNNLHEANIALDLLATKCGNIREPVISLADQCQSQWESMRGTALEPDVVSFNTVLKAWSKCAQSLADVRKHADLYVSNDQINTQVSSSLNDEHAQVYTAKDAAERVTLLLLSQEREYEKGHIGETARPDTVSYNEAISSWARSGVAEAPHHAERLLKRMMDHKYIQPNGASYGGVVDAWAHSGKPESLQKVKHIWEHMEQLHAENPDIKPGIRTVNSIIQAHSRRVQELVEQKDVEGARKTAGDAEEFLSLMKEKYEQTKDPDHMPDAHTYTSLMDAYGRVGRYHATLRGKALFEELEQLYRQPPNNPRLKPNVKTYTCMITAWSKTRSYDSTKEAERLLKIMNDSNDPDLQPNARTFTAVINAWSRSNDPTKAQRSLQILRHMKELYQQGNKDAAPSITTYNAAIDACAKCKGDLTQQTAALKIAFAILKAIQQEPNLEANAITFSCVLRACTSLIPAGEERSKVGSALFEKSKKAGVVDFYVLFNLRNCVEPQVLKDLLQGVQVDHNGNYDFNIVPAAWNRNVR